MPPPSLVPMRLHSPKESLLWLKALWNHHRQGRMTRAALEAAQLKRFRRLVARLRERSPYYRELIQDCGITPASCTPADFPILTKSEVSAHFDRMVTDPRLTRERVAAFLEKSTDPSERLDGRYHVLHTSGSSGTIGYYVYSHDDWITGVSQVVRASALRWRRRVAFVAATKGHFAGVSLMLAGNEGTNGLFYDVRPYDVGQPLPEIVAALNEFQPHTLSGYAAMLKVLGEAQERGELRISPHELGNGGEPLLPDVKAFLERVFQAPVLNGYACSEHLYMAMSLPGTQGLHLLEDDLIFELRPDCTLVTNLFNETLPLIRYRMDDVLVPDETPSPYPYRRIREVVGRQENALTFTNAEGGTDFIHPIVIAELVVPGLNAWQIVLEGPESFRFRARFEEELDGDGIAATRAAIRRRMDQLLAEKNMGNVTFEIEEVDSLAIDPRTGKFKLVVQERGTVGSLRAGP